MVLTFVERGKDFLSGLNIVMILFTLQDLSCVFHYTRQQFE